MPTTATSPVRPRVLRRKLRSNALQRAFGPDSALRERWQRLADHPRGEVVLGAGVLGILTVLAVPPRGWAAVGGGLFGAAAWVVRAPIGAVVIGILLAKVWSDPEVLDDSNS